MAFRLLGLVSALVSGWLLAVTAVAPAVADEHESVMPETLTGQIELLVVDNVAQDVSVERYYLLIEGSGQLVAYELIFEGDPPAGLETGDRIEIEGRPVGDKLWVDRWGDVAE